jgi:hypothetical protein
MLHELYETINKPTRGDADNKASSFLANLKGESS